MALPRIVVLDPNIAVEDVPGQQVFVAGVVASRGQRFKPAVGKARRQIYEVILARLAGGEYFQGLRTLRRGGSRRSAYSGNWSTTDIATSVTTPPGCRV
jgi:hypothetical protein